MISLAIILRIPGPDRFIDRNTAMALFSGAALFGTGLGPLVSGFIAQNTTWRWVFYLQIITGGLFILAVAIFFKETRGSVLVSRRAKLLNKWYEAREKVGLVGFEMRIGDGSKKERQRIRWKVKSDEERESLSKMIGISVYRPFRTQIDGSLLLLSTNPSQICYRQSRWFSSFLYGLHSAGLCFI